MRETALVLSIQALLLILPSKLFPTAQQETAKKQEVGDCSFGKHHMLIGCSTLHNT